MTASRTNWERARLREKKRERRAERTLGAMTDKRRRYLSAHQERLKRELLDRLRREAES